MSKRLDRAIVCLRAEIDSGRVSQTVYLSKQHARAILRELTAPQSVAERYFERLMDVCREAARSGRDGYAEELLEAIEKEAQ